MEYAKTGSYPTAVDDLKHMIDICSKFCEAFKSERQKAEGLIMAVENCIEWMKVVESDPTVDPFLKTGIRAQILMFKQDLANYGGSK